MSNCTTARSSTSSCHTGRTLRHDAGRCLRMPSCAAWSRISTLQCSWTSLSSWELQTVEMSFNEIEKRRRWTDENVSTSTSLKAYTDPLFPWPATISRGTLSRSDWKRHCHLNHATDTLLFCHFDHPGVQVVPQGDIFTASILEQFKRATLHGYAQHTSRLDPERVKAWHQVYRLLHQRLRVRVDGNWRSHTAHTNVFKRPGWKSPHVSEQESAIPNRTNMLVFPSVTVHLIL